MRRRGGQCWLSLKQTELVRSTITPPLVTSIPINISLVFPPPWTTSSGPSSWARPPLPVPPPTFSWPSPRVPPSLFRPLRLCAPLFRSLTEAPLFYGSFPAIPIHGKSGPTLQFVQRRALGCFSPEVTIKPLL